jgi:hypothetical protein
MERISIHDLTTTQQLPKDSALSTTNGAAAHATQENIPAATDLNNMLSSGHAIRFPELISPILPYSADLCGNQLIQLTRSLMPHPCACGF